MPGPAVDRPCRTWIDLPQNPAPPPDHRPLIVPVFLPHAGCPHRCVFCNQVAITGQQDACPEPDLVGITRRFLGGKPKVARQIEMAFYGSNFLGQNADRIGRLLAQARDLIRQGWIGAVRLSTRPDSIDDRSLALIAGGPVVTVELGGQSMDDSVLAASRRGHAARDTVQAVHRLRQAGLRVGIQMMIGLPGQDSRGAVQSAVRFADLKPDFMRIYPCLVLEKSPLADAYRQKTFQPLSLSQAVATTARLWRVFARRNIPVIRMGLQATAELTHGGSLIAGPFHPAFGDLVFSHLCHEALVRLFRRAAAAGKTVEIKVHPRRVSQVRGHGNLNLDALTRRFTPASLRVTADPDCPFRRLALIVS